MRWDSYSVMTAHQVGICVLVLGDPVGSWRASCALARVCGAGRGFVQYADELTKGYTKMVIAGAAARPTISASNFECAAIERGSTPQSGGIGERCRSHVTGRH